MKPTAQAVLIAALLATPLVSHAQTNQPRDYTQPGAAVDTPSAHGASSRSATATSAADFGEDPKAASQTGRGSGTTTLSPYSPPIRIAR